MNKLKKAVTHAFNYCVRSVISSVSQDKTMRNVPPTPPADGIEAAACSAACEGAVLLKNNNHILPLTENDTVSVFGRVQNDTFFVGYGSGGDVNRHYAVSISDGLKNCPGIKLNTELAEIYNSWTEKNPVDNGFWGCWPMHYEEMPVDKALCKNAHMHSNKAIVIIGRAAGEDRENTLTKGSYYLTDDEENMLRCVTSEFPNTAVLLNIGNIMDFSWVEKYNIPCVMIIWQGGMETGNAVAKLLSGEVSPSGKLTDTIAKRYEDYPSAEHFGGKLENTYTEDIFVGYRYFETFAPDKVAYCFGHGLSYTEFRTDNIRSSAGDGKITVSADITNTGSVNGKEVLQLYYSAPNGKLGKAKYCLADFCKTELLSPAAKQTVTLGTGLYDISSYDDAGITGYKSSYVLESGEYVFYIGTSVHDCVRAGSFDVPETYEIQHLSECSAVQPEKKFSRLHAGYKDGKVYPEYTDAPLRSENLKQKILSELPKGTPLTSDKGYTLKDVKDGKISVYDFTAQLDANELEAITRGDYVMNSHLGAPGNASVFAGVTTGLRKKGIPPVTCTDGPSGIRLATTASLLPSGTCLASSWNRQAVSVLYEKIGQEMLERHSDVLLAPGMNIHRNPLCGRNFEYYSEDPVVAGNIAAACVTGLQSTGVSACPKHFACNNQETLRVRNNSILSERALREIYLKGFEICVKSAHPHNIMTSYNKINGVWGHYNYDLCTTVLRNEWGYTGNVMTDWWMQSSKSPEFPSLSNQAYRVRAQVDVLMPGGARSGKRKPDGTLLATLAQPDGITVAELQRSAVNVLNFAMNSPAFDRFINEHNNKI